MTEAQLSAKRSIPLGKSIREILSSHKNRVRDNHSHNPKEKNSTQYSPFEFKLSYCFTVNYLNFIGILTQTHKVLKYIFFNLFLQELSGKVGSQVSKNRHLSLYKDFSL